MLASFSLASLKLTSNESKSLRNKLKRSKIWLTGNRKFDWECRRRRPEAELRTPAAASIVVGGAGLQRTNLHVVNFSWGVKEVAIRRTFLAGGGGAVFSGRFPVFYDWLRFFVRNPRNPHVILPCQWNVYLIFFNITKRKKKLNYTNLRKKLRALEYENKWLLTCWGADSDPPCCRKTSGRGCGRVYSGETGGAKSKKKKRINIFFSPKLWFNLM